MAPLTRRALFVCSFVFHKFSFSLTDPYPELGSFCSMYIIFVINNAKCLLSWQFMTIKMDLILHKISTNVHTACAVLSCRFIFPPKKWGSFGPSQGRLRGGVMGVQKYGDFFFQINYQNPNHRKINPKIQIFALCNKYKTKNCTAGTFLFVFRDNARHYSPQ